MRPRGFTLPELLVFTAIFSILVSVAIPSFNSQIQKARTEAVIYSLIDSIETARSKAVFLNQRTVLIANNNWHSGWELFVDENSNGLRDDNEALILTQYGFENISINDNFITPKQISFIGNGTSRTPSGAINAGTIKICTQTSVNVKLVMNSIGRLRMEKLKPTDCAS